jgi:hypothetical protein
MNQLLKMVDFDQLTLLVMARRESLSMEHWAEHDTWYSSFVSRVLAAPDFTGSLLPTAAGSRVSGDIPTSFR